MFACLNFEVPAGERMSHLNQKASGVSPKDPDGTLIANDVTADFALTLLW